MSSSIKSSKNIIELTNELKAQNDLKKVLNETVKGDGSLNNILESKKIGALFSGHAVDDERTYQQLIEKTPEILNQIPKPVKKKRVGRNQTVEMPGTVTFSKDKQEQANKKINFEVFDDQDDFKKPSPKFAMT